MAAAVREIELSGDEGRWTRAATGEEVALDQWSPWTVVVAVHGGGVAIGIRERGIEERSTRVGFVGLVTWPSEHLS